MYLAQEEDEDRTKVGIAIAVVIIIQAAVAVLGFFGLYSFHFNIGTGRESMWRRCPRWRCRGAFGVHLCAAMNDIGAGWFLGRILLLTVRSTVRRRRMTAGRRSSFRVLSQ